MNGDSWLEDMARKSRESGLGALAQPRRYHLAPCTGLHCTSPECRKRRKERLRLAWVDRICGPTLAALHSRFPGVGKKRIAHRPLASTSARPE